MSLKAKRESVLKRDIPSGQYVLTIANVNIHKKSTGEIITNNDCPGVIFTFSDDSYRHHQEVYWVNGFNHSKLIKLLAIIGVEYSDDIPKKQLLNKRFCGLIVEYRTMNGPTMIKSERKLTNFWSLSKGINTMPYEQVIYRDFNFNQTNENSD